MSRTGPTKQQIHRLRRTEEDASNENEELSPQSQHQPQQSPQHNRHVLSNSHAINSQQEQQEPPGPPLHLNDLQSSQQSTVSAQGGSSTASLSSLLSPPLDHCSCDQYHSLRCNDKLYSMLHNQIELDSQSRQRQLAAIAKKKVEQAELKALFGDDLPPEPVSTGDPTTEAAIWRYHASDFTLGNLKNQSTRVVIPPTVIYSRVRPTECYFTSMQTGGLLRKSKAKLTNQHLLEEFLSFSRRNISDALANLGRRNKRQDDVAWAMEKDEYTHELQFGRKPGQQQRQTSTSPGSSEQPPMPKSNLPHYMIGTKNLSRSFKSKAIMANDVIAQRARPNQRPASASVRTPTPQHPLTSSPSSQPQQHCDIIAQFTFSSDSLRYNDPYLPYTFLPPGVVPNTHDFPDILYLNIRSLHHFLNVVNMDLQHPRATGILQPFIKCADERNTVYRVSFTALDATASALRSSGSSSSTSAAIVSHSSLPGSFHVSIDARQNVLKLIDHSGLGSRREDGVEYTLAERAATFDAAHLSLQVDQKSPKSSNANGRRREADEYQPPSSTTSRTHILYPRLPSDLTSPPGLTTARSLTKVGHSTQTTLTLPNSYPFSPSLHTSAQRVHVPSALQARLQAAMLRMVAHVNELYRASERKTQEQRDRQVTLQRELYSSKSHSANAPPPPLIPLSPNISVGYMEVTFKIDASNNLYLLTCRSLKHLVCEPTDHAPTHSKNYVRCAQCYRLSDPVPDVLAVQSQLIRPTSAAFHSSSSQHESSSSATSPKNDLQTYQTPFYARGRNEYAEEEAEERRRRQRAAQPQHGRTTSGSALVFGVRKRRAGDEDDEDGRDDENDRSLWPESHFNPPPLPASKFSNPSDRIQVNPLFDSTNDDDLIRNEDAEVDEEEDGSGNEDNFHPHPRSHDSNHPHEPHDESRSTNYPSESPAAAGMNKQTRPSSAVTKDRVKGSSSSSSTSSSIRRSATAANSLLSRRSPAAEEKEVDRSRTDLGQQRRPISSTVNSAGITTSARPPSSTFHRSPAALDLDGSLGELSVEIEESQ